MRVICLFLVVAAFVATAAVAHSDEYEDVVVFRLPHIPKTRFQRYVSSLPPKVIRRNMKKGVIVFGIRDKFKKFGEKMRSGFKKFGEKVKKGMKVVGKGIKQGAKVVGKHLASHAVKAVLVKGAIVAGSMLGEK